MPGRPGEADEPLHPEQVQRWLKDAVPAVTVAFDESGAGVLVVGRRPLSIADTVILVRYDQVAQLAGAFLLNVVAPGIAAAMQLDVQVQGRPIPRGPG